MLPTYKRNNNPLKQDAINLTTNLLALRITRSHNDIGFCVNTKQLENKTRDIKDDNSRSKKDEKEF